MKTVVEQSRRVAKAEYKATMFTILLQKNKALTKQQPKKHLKSPCITQVRSQLSLSNQGKVLFFRNIGTKQIQSAAATGMI